MRECTNKWIGSNEIIKKNKNLKHKDYSFSQKLRIRCKICPKSRSCFEDWHAYMYKFNHRKIYTQRFKRNNLPNSWVDTKTKWSGIYIKRSQLGPRHVVIFRKTIHYQEAFIWPGVWIREIWWNTGCQLCYRNWDKLWQDRSPGFYTDFDF